MTTAYPLKSCECQFVYPSGNGSVAHLMLQKLYMSQCVYVFNVTAAIEEVPNKLSLL